jgi:long-chain fatty acid transport protein
MNANPAGLTQIRGRTPNHDFEEESYLGIGTILPSLHFRNSRNDKDGENTALLFSDGGYVRRLNKEVTVGVGLFTIGGFASDFRDLTTALGNRDKRGSTIRHIKLAPSIGYQVTDKLSMGAALAVSYVDASLTVFPNTPGGFETIGKCNRANGIALPASCAYALAFIPKFGAMYKLTEEITVGLAYTMRAPLPLDHSQIARNQPGIGRVTYDAHVRGVKWPDDLAAGIAVRPRKNLLIAAKFQWINWEAAFNNATIEMTSGIPAKPTDAVILNFQWRTQYVMALGAALDVTDRVNMHVGYNYGNNPVPRHTMDPIISSIVEHHLVGGAKYQLTEALSLDGLFTHAFKKSRTYDSNFAFPLGLGTNVSSEVGGNDFMFALTYRP